jgi:hypothetical protein
MFLKSLSLIFERLRSKTFSPVCLSRFLEFLSLIRITTQSFRGEGFVVSGSTELAEVSAERIVCLPVGKTGG